MSESVDNLNKCSVTSSELEAQSVDRPLSPVLSTNKVNRRILFGRRYNRQRSRVQLLDRFQTCPVEPEGTSSNLSCSPTCSSSQQSNQSSNAEERLRKIKRLEEERRRCYNYICGSRGNRQKSGDFPVKDFEFQQPSSAASSSKLGTNSTSSRNETSDWRNGDRGESSSAFTMQMPSDKSLNLLSIVNEQSELCDTLNSTRGLVQEKLVPVKNQRLSRIPRPNKTPKKNANHRDDCLKPTDFQSASGKEIVVSETELSAMKAIFSDENLNDVLKSSPDKRKTSTRTSSGSNLILTESLSSVVDKKTVESAAASNTTNKIYSNGNFHEFSSETNSEMRPTKSSPAFGVRLEADCNASNATTTVDSSNVKLILDNDISQNKYFNCVSDTQMMTAADNALSAMEFCSDDWGESFCKIVDVSQNCDQNVKEQKEAEKEEGPFNIISGMISSCGNSSENVAYIRSQPQVDEFENFPLNTQETNLYFEDVSLNENAGDLAKAQDNFEESVPVDEEPKENIHTQLNTEAPNGVSSKNTVNVNIPPGAVDCRTLYAKNLIELHRNKNFTGNSEESVHASSNYKISQQGVEVKRRTVRTHRKCTSVKCDGFCECEQEEAEERLIKVIKNIKKTEAHLNEMEKSLASKHRRAKEKITRKEVVQAIIIGDVIREEGEENVIEQEEHPNVAATEEKIVGKDRKSKRRKDKSKHHRGGKDVPNELELHTMKKMRRDCKETSTDGNEEKKNRHKQKLAEIKEEESKDASTCTPVSPEKCKKHSRNHKQRKTADCAIDNQNLVELSPTQKKFKIEIDCSNKLRINISCNAQPQSDKQQHLPVIENGEFQVIKDAIKNRCDKSTSVSGNMLIVDKSNQKATTFHASAVTENKLLNMKGNVDHKQQPPDYCSFGIDVKKEKAFKKISDRPQKIHGVELESKTDYVVEKEMGAPKKHFVGFKSASGKQITISGDALKKAEHRFEEDVENVSLKRNRKTQAGQKEILQTAVDKANDLITSKPCDFTFASGKLIKLSEDAIKKAENVYREIEKVVNPDNYLTEAKIEKKSNEKDYSSGDHSSGEKENAFVGFKSASGKNVLISESSLNDAQKLFDHQSINFSMGDFEKPENPNPNATEFPSSSKINTSASKKAFELLEDVVLTVDNALEKINDKRRSVKSTSKRRLGISRCKQIPISKEKLHQAGLMFEDTSQITPNIMGNSTPVRNELRQVKTLFPNPGLSPITVGKRNDLSSSSIVLHSKTEGNVGKWREEVSKQIVELRRKLEILGERKLGLEIQKDSLEFGDKEHRRQRSGILFINKQDAKKRLPLKNLQWGDGNGGKLSETILEMTPKNAEYLHFNCARSDEKENVRMQATTDGAMVIPNLKNLVGLSEIEVAFKTMAGVEPGLIAPGWITNHYQLIVWKLASYERVFPQHLGGCLCVENIVRQLKYRYDREIDRAERSAVRRILEKDDVPQKRMVLCVSDIYRVDGDKIEFQLTDGWYFLRTVADDPLSKQVQTQKIRIGTKLITQMADLLNCDGCHPLQVTDAVRLRIGYNCTRRAVWHAKLGYQRCPEPFIIPMKTIHPKGGMIACLKMYVARVYPIRYLEQSGGAKTWRNEKAEEKRAREFENEQLEKMEKIHYDVEREYNREVQLESKNTKISRAELLKINCPRTLHGLIETSNDPDSLMETLSTGQRIAVLEFRQSISLQRQQDISHRISQRVEKLKLTRRKVVPILKLLVLDANDRLERAYQFYVWNPTEEHVHMLKEDSVFFAYNITPRFNGDLFSNSKTHFKLEKSVSSCHSKTKRQLYPLAMIQDPYYKPFFNEFDTVGLVAQVNGTDNEQELWLGDFMGRVLHVKIKDGPKECCLLDGIARGEIVSLSNLIYCQPQKDFAQAIANQFTIISSYPQQKFLQEGIEMFKIQVSKDLTKLLDDCDKLIARCRVNPRPKSGGLNNSNNVSEIADDSSEDNSVIPTRLTATDIAMSLIDTQQFY